MTTCAEQAILDAHFMARALELARKGHYTTHPNPRVGCVIVQLSLIHISEPTRPY